MAATGGTMNAALALHVDLRGLEERLQALATQLATWSQVPSPDAIEFHCRSTALQRAVFILRSELATGDLELRDHAT